MTDTPAGISDIQVKIAELTGKVEVVIARMEAGDRQSAQLITLVKDQLTYQTADLGELKAIVREHAIKTETAISTVRTDLELKITHNTEEIDTLKLWRARIGGIAVAASIFSSALTGLVLKVVGM